MFQKDTDHWSGANHRNKIDDLKVENRPPFENQTPFEMY